MKYKKKKTVIKTILPIMRKLLYFDCQRDITTLNITQYNNSFQTLSFVAP